MYQDVKRTRFLRGESVVVMRDGVGTWSSEVHYCGDIAVGRIELWANLKTKASGGILAARVFPLDQARPKVVLVPAVTRDEYGFFHGRSSKWPLPVCTPVRRIEIGGIQQEEIQSLVVSLRELIVEYPLLPVLVAQSDGIHTWWYPAELLGVPVLRQRSPFPHHPSGNLRAVASPRPSTEPQMEARKTRMRGGGYLTTSKS